MSLGKIAAKVVPEEIQISARQIRSLQSRQAIQTIPSWRHSGVDGRYGESFCVMSRPSEIEGFPCTAFIIADLRSTRCGRYLDRQKLAPMAPRKRSEMKFARPAAPGFPTIFPRSRSGPSSPHPPLQQGIWWIDVVMMLECAFHLSTDRDCLHRISQQISYHTHATGMWDFHEHRNVRTMLLKR
jgi:hypothetical protein